MEYILSDKKGQPCPFCAYASAPESELRKSLVLVAAAHAFVVLNRYPFVAGHLLVVSNRHVSDIQDLSEAEHDALFRLVRDTAKRLSLAVRCQGVNIGINLGPVAGAGIAEHLHVHIVPRWSGDTNFMPVIADVRVMPQHLDATFERLAPHFADVPGRRAGTSQPGGS
jgi:ATP adenylyltransferase